MNRRHDTGRVDVQEARYRVADGDCDYDVALSFAGEDREYVEEVARILHALGVRVFYAILRKIGLQTELDEMVDYLSAYLVDYTIQADGTDLCFKCEKEQYEGHFPIRLLLEIATN